MRSLWWLASAQSQMSNALSESMAMALSEQSINTNFMFLEEPKMIEGLPNPQDTHDRAQDPSCYLKLITIKSPQDSHPYTTHLKGRHPVPFLSTTTVMGSSRLRPAQPQTVTFCSRCTGKPEFRTMPEGADPAVIHFYFLYFCGQHLELAS